MSQTMKGQVGKQTLANGSKSEVRQVREGELAVTTIHGDYYQKVAEGDAYVLNAQNITLAAANTIATLGATCQPIIGIFNGGSKNIAVNRVRVATRSGTAGAGGFFWAIAAGQSPSALTLMTSTGTVKKTYASGLPSGVKLSINQALTGLIGSLTVNEIAGSLNTVTASLGYFESTSNGEIIVPAGAILCLLATNIGTTHAIDASVNITEVEVTA